MAILQGRDSVVFFQLDTTDVMGEDVVNTFQHIIAVGNNKYKGFVKDRLINRSKPITQ